MGSTPLGTQTLTRTDGRVVAWSEFGDPVGAPVLWCHGGLSSRLDVALVDSTLLELGARVVSPDRPGIGSSERRKVSFSIDSKEGPDTADLAGQSVDLQDRAISLQELREVMKRMNYTRYNPAVSLVDVATRGQILAW